MVEGIRELELVPVFVVEATLFAYAARPLFHRNYCVQESACKKLNHQQGCSSCVICVIFASFLIVRNFYALRSVCETMCSGTGKRLCW